MKYTITFLLLGALVSFLAYIWGNWWHFLHWFSFSCFALSAGYAGLGPQVFGKQTDDGHIPVWSKVIHLPYMAFAECVWQLARLLSSENPTDTVTDDIILGRRLRVSELPEAVSNYVDLTAETEDPKAIRDSASYITFPILDASVPSSTALKSAVSQLPPGRTFIHCAQGHGRTGLFALALLLERRHIRSFKEGIELIKAARPGVRLNTTQEAFIRNYITEQTYTSGI